MGEYDQIETNALKQRLQGLEGGVSLPEFDPAWVERAPTCKVKATKVLYPGMGRLGGVFLVATLLVTVFLTGWHSASTSDAPEGFHQGVASNCVEDILGSTGLEEVIYLKSGNRLYGRVIMQQGRNLLVMADGNRNIKIDSSRISRIKYFCRGDDCLPSDPVEAGSL